MEHIQWIFSGIGTQILSAIGGLIIGGLIGYKIRDRRIGKQKQKGGKHSNQRQEFHIDSATDPAEDSSADNVEGSNRYSINQNQKAGDDSTQVQIGGIGKRG